MIGLICNDEIALVGHGLFNNFRLALYNYFNQTNFKEIKSVQDVTNDIKQLIIVDEHFAPNVNIWKTSNFINTVNSKNIKVIVFNFEKIYNSSFPWNIDHQNKLTMFKHLIQIVSDTDDAIILKKNIINKQFLSKDTNLNIQPKPNKINKILFIGQLDGAQYSSRRDIIHKLQNIGLNIEVVQTNRKLSYIDFLNKMNEYMFILNPLGTGKFINLRHYEAIRLGCTPVQQITDSMIKFYPPNGNAIYFSDPLTIKLRLTNFISLKNETFLENYFDEIKLNDII